MQLQVSTVSKKSLRDSIIQRRGVSKVPYRGLSRKLPRDKTGTKSILVRNIEARFNQRIEDILSSKLNPTELARLLEVDRGTIYRWKEKYLLSDRPTESIRVPELETRSA